MKRLIFTLLISWCSIYIYAQSEDERLTRAMYNRIEFFFNSQQTDSIYQLSSTKFRQQVSADQFNNALTQLYTLGKINSVDLISYERGIAKYKADFPSKTLAVQIELNEDKTKFSTLIFQPYSAIEQPIAQKEEPVISDVEKVDPLDFAIDSLARTYIQQKHTQALAVAIIRKNKVKKFFYGETDPGNGKTPDENSIFEIGSITKTLTATLLANLIEKGEINLEESIAKFLPDSVAKNPAISKITFRTLANHTSGLPRLPDNLSKITGFDKADPYASYDREALFTFLRHFKASREPEEEYEYSNLGYGLLGELVSIVAKKSYEEQVKETVLIPLHMSGTSTIIDPKNENRLKVYDKSGKEVSQWSFKAFAGAGALKSTANDMLRYAIVQLRRPESELEQSMALTKLFTYFIPPNTDVGLGWHMNMIEDVTCYWHNGSTGGSSAYIALIPDIDSAVIVLSNSAISVDEIAQSMIHKTIITK